MSKLNFDIRKLYRYTAIYIKPYCIITKLISRTLANISALYKTTAHENVYYNKG